MLFGVIWFISQITALDVEGEDSRTRKSAACLVEGHVDFSKIPRHSRYSGVAFGDNKHVPLDEALLLALLVGKSNLAFKHAPELMKWVVVQLYGTSGPFPALNAPLPDA